MITDAYGRLVEAPPHDPVDTADSVKSLVVRLAYDLKKTQEALDVVQRYGNQTLDELRALRRLERAVREEAKAIALPVSSKIVSVLSELNEIHNKNAGHG